MRVEVLIAGRGGQGILLMGHVLGNAAARYSGYYVTATESYSAETRGGDSRADVIIADSEEELDYIKVRRADVAVFMFSEQAVKYSGLVPRNSSVFIDTTYVRDMPAAGWRVFGAPYTRIAEVRVGTFRVANLVALGHVVGVTGLVKPEHVLKSVEDVVREEWVKANKEAFKLGLKLPRGITYQP